MYTPNFGASSSAYYQPVTQYQATNTPAAAAAAASPTSSKAPLAAKATPHQEVIYAPPVIAASKLPNPSRFALVAPPVAAAPAAAPAAPSAVPQSLKNFIKRSLAAYETPEDRALLTVELEKIVSKATQQQRLHIHSEWHRISVLLRLTSTLLFIDWDKEPIPIIARTESKQKVVNVVQTVKESVESPTAKITSKRKSRWEEEASLVAAPSQPETPSKKSRKSRFDFAPPAANPPPVNQNQGKPIIQTVDAASADELALRNLRASRFQDTTSTKKKNQAAAKSKRQSISLAIDDEFDIDKLKVIGTSRELEKDYFRLTSAPDPSSVRPLNVLIKSLQLIKKKWSERIVEYIYICSQLKSVRQDLTVQHIRDGKSRAFLIDIMIDAHRIYCGSL